MGGSPKQVNSGQATQANNNAQTSINQSNDLEKTQAGLLTSQSNYLFGEDGKGGTLGAISPGAPDKGGSPTGVYGTVYNNAVQQGARDYSNARGTLAQQWANNGFAGGMPNGFKADQERKLASSAADANGANFTDLATKSHQEDLNNFWNATNIRAGQAATSGQQAVQAAGNSGNTASSMYSTAGKQANNPVLGAALGAAGTAASGALQCPARGSMIRTKRGDIAVEELSAGDQLLQSDGHFRSLPEDPYMVLAECVDIDTQRERRTRVSEGHAFSSNGGGYVDAIASRNCEVRAHHEKDLVVSVAKSGRCEVFVMPKFGNNTYLSDDLWSLT